MSNPKRISDTSAMPEAERITRTLMGLMGQSPPGLIEAQEAQGQRDLVASEQLPVDGTEGHEDQWAKMGVVLLPKTGDDIFRDTQLPEGWKKVRTEHSMWSELQDANGNVRAMIFYKAAFYDRSARVHFNHRYRCTQDYEVPDDCVRWIVQDATKAEPIHEVRRDGLPNKYKNAIEHYKAVQDLEAELGYSGGCDKWLEENYQDFKDPTAYWVA